MSPRNDRTNRILVEFSAEQEQTSIARSSNAACGGSTKRSRAGADSRAGDSAVVADPERVDAPGLLERVRRLRHAFTAITPPILTRAISGVVGFVRWYPLLRGPSRERGPGWYDRTFDLSDLWNQHYTESSSYPMWSVIADRLVHRGMRSVLELGCGSGQFAALLRDRGIGGYVGLDFSPRRIEQARRVCSEFLFHAEDVLTSERLSQGGYDAVVANAFLEHVEADTRIVEGIRPRTLFLGFVPNFPSPSHVRHFNDEAEVAQRYQRFFSDFRTDSFLLDSKGRIVYLFEGVRR